MAIAAHPDDIEFLMGGTLLLLGKAGYETHYMTVASGSCGSVKHSAVTTRTIRKREAKAAAGVLGAQFHPSFVDDLEILYDLKLLRRLAARIREVAPRILLVPSPQDYMEDHTNTSRLCVTAAFARGMPNFRTSPRRKPVDQQMTVYHAMPYGLRDPLRRRIIPGIFVDTSSVYPVKQKALACHESQQDWLAQSQGLSSYLKTMETMSLEVGSLSGAFEHAEGWRRHSHHGFAETDSDPLKEALSPYYRQNRAYEDALEEGRIPTGD